MDDLGSFLSGLQGRLFQQAQIHQDVGVKRDDELAYFCTPAPNAIVWATAADYLNVPSVFHHVREYQIIRDFFQLRCPLSTCNDQSPEAKDCWNKTEEQLKAEVLLVWDSIIQEDICPRCRTTRSEFVKDGLLKKYNQIHVVAGMRSGKSATAAILGTYVEHRLLTIGHAQPGAFGSYFNQLPVEPFEMTFIASTDVQSADTIWAKFTSLRGNSPWFKKYARWIKRKEKEQSASDGSKPWVYEERSQYIINEFLNFKINSMNSNSAGMAGRTRMVAFIDELARFENTEGKRGGDEAYRVLENSLRTIRSAVENNRAVPWLGTMVSISSPISEDDKCMRLLRQGPSIRGMYTGHYATWEFNPDQPRRLFDDDFAKDPIGAMRDFGARPPTTASPLITDPAHFRALAIQQDLKATAIFRKLIHQDRTGREYISAAIESAQLLRNGERYICFDAGASFDQFAGACAHGEWIQVPEGRALITVYDWVFRLLPENKPRRDVWFDFVVQAIEYLTKYYHIGRVEFDRWQSTYLIQQIRNRGVHCEVKGTEPEMFLKLVNDVNYSKVRMLPPLPTDDNSEPPFKSPAGLAFYELEHLERSPDNKKIENPKKGERRGFDSDDVATVVAHVNDMVQSSVVDISNSNSTQDRLRREQAGGHSWTSGTLFHPVISRRMW